MTLAENSDWSSSDQDSVSWQRLRIALSRSASAICNLSMISKAGRRDSERKGNGAGRMSAG
jgi:hypothetical protein